MNYAGDDSCGLTPAAPADLNLGPLAANGGPTRTHALLPGSVAIDATDCTDAAGDPVATDQRGVSRPQGLACDVGAYERSPQPSGFVFTGFFAPVSNHALNSVKAGQAVPVRFSLGGNKGLNIFDSGFPTTQHDGGLRMEDHPRIVFRSDPAGCRAASSADLTSGGDSGGEMGPPGGRITEPLEWPGELYRPGREGASSCWGRLGGAATVRRLEVRWPSGACQVLEDLSVDPLVPGARTRRRHAGLSLRQP